MASGGSRNRSGPQADPNSERSQQRGLAYKLLPAKGYTGRAPSFPLPDPSPREKEVWKTLWKTPQAAMWNVERHRMMNVGHYCRLLVRCEDFAAPASLHAQLHRFADQLGMTPAGLRENGWRIGGDELADKRATTSEHSDEEPSQSKTKPAATPKPVRRLRAVNG